MLQFLIWMLLHFRYSNCTNKLVGYNDNNNLIYNQRSYRHIYLFYLFLFLLFSHNKDYTSITLYKDVARGPQKTTRLVRGGPLVTIILSNRTITTHNNGQYKTHYRYSRKSKTFVLKDCNVKIEVTEFGKEFQILGPWNKIENCLVLVRQA